MIFADRPFLDRIDLAAANGVPAFEFWRWDNKDIPAIAERAQGLGIACAAFAASSEGSLVDPASQVPYLNGLRVGLQHARALGTTTLIVTTGNARSGVERAAQHDAIVAGLRAAAPMAADAGITLALEPLNTLVDHRGYYLDSTAEGLQIVAEVASPSVKLLYDFYHAQIMEGSLIATATANLASIAHLHVADNPGRNEPGTGEIDYRNVFRAIDAAGYTGHVGLEYRPTGDHAASLRSTIALAS
ncbi:MAG: hydroxypyruvate isomerase [Chloroflexota bacterium]|nr:MAG: hydroxypyruvate isomerase [Chloroflexota bacterium]